MIIKSFKAADESMQDVFDFIHGQFQKDSPAELLNKVDLAVEEIFINIAHYAYTPENGNVEISCELENNLLTVIFCDTGKKFNPLAQDEPDTSLSLEERKIGGLGIFLTKQFMDSVSYEYIKNQNRLTIQKKIP